MLRALIESWGAMDIPEDCSVTCLIVENDSEALSEAVVTAARPLPNGADLSYVLEPELGIPFGRNRAAKEAIARGDDLLAFVDDDEVVAQDWLVRLIDGYRQSDAVLMGAPLRAAPVHDGASWSERIMHRNVAARYAKKENRAARRADLHGTPGVTIVTNNWLADLKVFTEHDLWFDEKMRFTGGTDAKFHAELRKLGLPSGWVKDAFVYETVPPERLSFAYQYRRAKDQSNTNFRRKFTATPAARLGALVSVPAKTLSAILLAVALPFTRGGTLLDLARTLGWISGRVGALFGIKSKLYEETTGA
jgi:GT2 family glycosyltransferase